MKITKSYLKHFRTFFFFLASIIAVIFVVAGGSMINYYCTANAPFFLWWSISNNPNCPLIVAGGLLLIVLIVSLALSVAFLFGSILIDSFLGIISFIKSAYPKVKKWATKSCTPRTCPITVLGQRGRCA